MRGALVSIVSYLKKISYQSEKRSWELFRSCLLNSKANPADFHPNWAGLALLFKVWILQEVTSVKMNL
jgi:hypothetical protein